MHWWQYLLLPLFGMVAGFANVMAGGGSLLTVPLLIFLGFPTSVANGTNRVGVLIQSISAATAFRNAGLSNMKLSFTLGLAALPGSLLGALSVVRLDDAWFKRVLAVVMVGTLVAMLWPNKKKAAQRDKSHLVAAHIGMVLTGFYGGFIQAGVGFILMPILRRTLGLNLVHVNMHKVLIVGIYTLPALLVFVYYGTVHWFAGLALAAGTAVGGLLATRMQVKKGEGPVRIIFAIAVVAMATKLALG